MALDRIDFPTTPNPVTGDWALINALMTKAFQNIQSPLQWSGTTVPQGTVVQIGGVIYYGTSDTTITGTPSNYVKFTPNVGDSGATCDVAFIANLSGVSWSKLYNGYYISGNLVVFDEIKAIIATDLANGNSKFSELWEDHINTKIITKDITMDDGVANVDRNIKFASDADFLWDESEDIFNLNKRMIFSSRLITSANYIHSTSISYNDIFDKMSPFIPTTGNIVIANGSMRQPGGAQLILNRVKRNSSTVMYLTGYNLLGDDVIEHTITDGDSQLIKISLAW